MFLGAVMLTMEITQQIFTLIYAIAVLLTCVNESNNDILLVLGRQSRDLTLCIGGQAHEIP
jgi:hypothetical protein